VIHFFLSIAANGYDPILARWTPRGNSVFYSRFAYPAENVGEVLSEDSHRKDTIFIAANIVLTR
jgi:hypothetical protein